MSVHGNFLQMLTCCRRMFQECRQLPSARVTWIPRQQSEQEQVQSLFMIALAQPLSAVCLHTPIELCRSTLASEQEQIQSLLTLALAQPLSAVCLQTPFELCRSTLAIRTCSNNLRGSKARQLRLVSGDAAAAPVQDAFDKWRSCMPVAQLQHNFHQLLQHQRMSRMACQAVLKHIPCHPHNPHSAACKRCTFTITNWIMRLYA